MEYGQFNPESGAGKMLTLCGCHVGGYKINDKAETGKGEH